MKKEGPSEDLVNRAKESARREHETGMKQNGYWISRLQAANLLGHDPVAHILGREQRIAAVTSRQSQGGVRQVLPAGAPHHRDARSGEVELTERFHVPFSIFHSRRVSHVRR